MQEHPGLALNRQRKLLKVREGGGGGGGWLLAQPPRQSTLRTAWVNHADRRMVFHSTRVAFSFEFLVKVKNKLFAPARGESEQVNSAETR